MTDNQKIREILPVLLDLQEDKEKCYGSSWCKKGEVRGIMGNIDRKYDRLDTITNLEIEGKMKRLADIEKMLTENPSAEVGETKIDTIGDLSLYGLLYMTYVKENFPRAFQVWVDRNIPKHIREKDSVNQPLEINNNEGKTTLSMDGEGTINLPVKKINESKTIHRLKIYPKFFKAVKNGTKTFEVREDDRDYKVGDLVILKEYDPTTNTYTGELIQKRIGYILKDLRYIAGGCCVFSLLDV